MKTFQYRGFNNHQQVEHGMINSLTKQSAEQELRQKGIIKPEVYEIDTHRQSCTIVCEVLRKNIFQ